MNTTIVIFILVLICIFLSITYLYRRPSIKNNECVQKAHYYMFTLDRYDILIYVTGNDKFSTEKIDDIKKSILNKLNINDDEEIMNEFGISYLGYLSQIEFKKVSL